MDIDYNFFPWQESQKRKAEALAEYRRFFGEDAPASNHGDARYLAAITALMCELKATPKDVQDFEAMLKDAPRHAD